MTRVGRSLQNLLDIMQELDRRGVDVIFIDQHIDTSTANKADWSSTSWPALS